MGNWFKTTLLLGIMTALIVFFGQLLGGRQGMIFAFILALGMNFFSYWYSDKIVLRMHRAVEITPQQHPRIHDMVREIALRAGLPMPRVYLIPEEAPNAFATGRNPEHAVVAVTEGLLRLMSDEEVKGVLAHEMAHIRNRDILIGSIAATMAGAVMILASMARWTAFLGGGGDDEEGGGLGMIGILLVSFIAPVAAMLVQMAVSRSREYHADETGAGFIARPDSLADALEKLGSYSRRIPMSTHPETAHMFIVNPLSGGGIAGLFSTHPPIEERIARLRGRRNDSSPGPSPRNEEEAGLESARKAWENLK